MHLTPLARRLVARQLVCFALAAAAAQALAAEPLRIGRNQGPMAELTDTSVLVLKAAYDKLGVDVRFEEYPLRRSLALADAGMIDGDVIRIAETSEKYPNLLRVDVPIGEVEITVYARVPCPALKGWDGLRGRRVAYERGVLAIERRLAGMVAVEAQDKPELFRLLKGGMVEFALGTGLETDVILRRRGDTSLCRVDTVLERLPLYHHLHKRHAALAQALQAQLQGMRQRGEIDAILRRERTRLLSQ